MWVIFVLPSMCYSTEPPNLETYYHLLYFHLLHYYLSLQLRLILSNNKTNRHIVEGSVSPGEISAQNFDTISTRPRANSDRSYHGYDHNAHVLHTKRITRYPVHRTTGSRPGPCYHCLLKKSITYVTFEVFLKMITVKSLI